MWRAIVIALVLAIAAVAVAACGELEPEGPPTFAAEPEMTVEELRPYSVVLHYQPWTDDVQPGAAGGAAGGQ